MTQEPPRHCCLVMRFYMAHLAPGISVSVGVTITSLGTLSWSADIFSSWTVASSGKFSRYVNMYR